MIPVKSKHPGGYVVIPTGITPRFIEFFDCLDQLQVPGGTMKIRLGGPDCDNNRNRGLDAITQDVAPWVAFLDDDQQFGPMLLLDLLDAMAETPDADAMTGFYTKKVPPFQPVLYKPFDGERFNLLQLDDLKPEIMHVGASGAGALLVKGHVFKTLEKPWFVPGHGRSYGGDIGLAHKMHEAGFKLYADLRQSVGHLMVTSVKPVWKDGSWSIQFDLGGNTFDIEASCFQQMVPRRD